MDPKSSENLQNPQGNTPENLNGYKSTKKMPSTTVKVVVLVVLIVLLIAGILLPIKLVPNAVSDLASSISSIFVPNSKATLSTDTQNIISGQSFTLLWTGKHRTDGSYAISYPCTDGLHFQTSVNQSNETITCGNPYYFSSNDNSIVLTPVSDNNNAVINVPLTLTFLPNNTSTVNSVGDLAVIINNSNVASNIATSTIQGSNQTASNQTATSTVSVTQEPPTQATTTSTQPQTTPENPTTIHHHYVSNPNGTPDLSIRILATGFLDVATHEFIPSKEVNGDQQAAIRFQIMNIGDKTSGTWKFDADLPTQSNSHFVSDPQQSLNPGDKIVYTLGLDGINPTEINYAYFHVDPDHSVHDANRSNNTATVTLINNSGTNVSTNGKPDLSVNIIASGIMSNGTFVTTPHINTNESAAVRFEVVNTGNMPTGTWNFNAVLPTYGQNTVYTSDPEESLAPGQKATFTLRFDNLANQGANIVTIHIDPNNLINEVSKNNNTASVTLYRN